MGERLSHCWERYRACFRNATRDPSHYAYHYLSGQLRLETSRNFTRIADEAGVSMQNVQHFMSASPWSAGAVCRQVQDEIAQTPGLPSGGGLILDESADERAGTASVGAARQHNGRLGKVELSQVGVFLAYAHGSLWTWVDGALYLPQAWFSEALAAERKRLGVPPERTFATKIELGWELIQRTAEGPLPFAVVLADALYGQSEWFREQLDWHGLAYLVDVPADTQVFLTQPEAVARQQKRGPTRRTPANQCVQWRGETVRVAAVGSRADTTWETVTVRPTERGHLTEAFAVRQVWTDRAGVLTAEVLVIRREAPGKESYALGNLPVETPLAEWAYWKCQRYFVERSNQDAKSEAGWDELVARKYRAWEHHLALTVLASWFVAQTKWEWAQTYARDPELLRQFEVEVLPALSMANVRTLLRAVLPLRQLDLEEAAAQVVTHLVNRTRSRRSRLKGPEHNHAPP